MSEPTRNSYLDEVVAQQAQLQQDLNVKRRAAPAPRPAAPGAPMQALGGGPPLPQAAGPAVDVRITGWWRWKNVIVPPNALVVHTRRGHAEPLHLGLGISFPFDPVTDSFLAVPAAMQTILINARSICKERQGILIQGYVQWIIEDFKTAYRKLDFTDVDDPMRVVNLQLREQAEAAIKDKVATMSVDDILADKQPIIRELTARLRQVAEGEGADEGLGLRIVTVQIKEAVVSSSTLWETLQRPFRAERAKEARLAEIAAQAVVRQREGEDERTRESEEIARQAEVARTRAESDAKAFDREQAERARRAKIEAEAERRTLEHEKEKLAVAHELGRVRLEAKVAQQELELTLARRPEEQAIALEEKRRRVENDLSPAALQVRLLDMLPELAAKMPQPKELRSVTVGGDGLGSLVSSVQSLLDKVRGSGAPGASAAG